MSFTHFHMYCKFFSSSSARFIVILVQTVSECVKTGVMTIRTDRKNGHASALHEPDKVEINQENEPDGLSVGDTRLLTGLLEVGVVLWEGVRVRMDKQSHSKLKKKLTEEISGRLPVLLDNMMVSVADFCMQI